MSKQDFEELWRVFHTVPNNKNICETKLFKLNNNLLPKFL